MSGEVALGCETWATICLLVHAREPGQAAPYHHSNEGTYIALVHDDVAQAVEWRCFSQLSQTGAHYRAGGRSHSGSSNINKPEPLAHT